MRRRRKFVRIRANSWEHTIRGSAPKALFDFVLQQKFFFVSLQTFFKNARKGFH